MLLDGGTWHAYRLPQASHSYDGAHGWKPGSARFTDPRGGDLVLRGFLGTGPHTGARIVATVAFDKVWDDRLSYSYG